uniref:Si:ch211-214j24.10 n=1 Tax=Amphilophus citrinellus TaxID=61819 RepID=A0A3Q0RMV1_AMPCI
MHIKTGTWEASNTVCEPDGLCDQAVLVSAANSEPHIRNRRLSPGSGNCGGGGGGGCMSGGDQLPRQLSPDRDLIGPSHAFSFRREKERKGQQHKGRSLRRESQKGVGRVSERPHKVNQKERWVEDSLSLLKPPPAFPVQDSPAKLQPAVSYASKVKAGAASGALEEDRPAIGMLLQNQWEVSTSLIPVTRAEVDESNGKLLLSCRHLVEALSYHSKDPKRVVWYKDTKEHPA